MHANKGSLNGVGEGGLDWVFLVLVKMDVSYKQTWPPRPLFWLHLCKKVEYTTSQAMKLHQRVTRKQQVTSKELTCYEMLNKTSGIAEQFKDCSREFQNSQKYSNYPLCIKPTLCPALCQVLSGSLELKELSDFTFTFHLHALEKEMATHFSVLAWRIPGMGEPGGLLSMGSHRVGHDCSDLAAAAELRQGFPGGSVVKNPPAKETWVWSLGWEDLLEVHASTWQLR